MAKAPTSVSIAKIHGNPAIGAAAAQIVALINSRPGSPREDEIAAIIASVATSGSSGPAGEVSAAGAPAPVIDGHLEEWCRVVGEFLAKINSGDVNMKDKETAELHDRVIATSIAIWARPVRSWNDILMRAMVAGYWNIESDFEIAQGDQTMSLDERSIAYLMRGIMDLGGLSFDCDGRLLPVQQRDGRVAALPSSSEHRWQATPLGAEWLALEAELFRAVAVSDVQPDDPTYERGQTAVEAIHDRVAACATRIWAMPVTNLRDAVIRVTMCGALAEHFSDQTNGYSGDGTLLPLEFLKPETRPAVCDDSAIAHLLDACRQLVALWST
jgi:hypothetical protein